MDNKVNSMNISMKSIFDIVFRNKLLIITIFILCMAGVLIGLQFVTPVYDANVKMLVKGQSIVSSETYAPIMGSVHRTQAEIVKSYPVLKRAAIALNLEKRPLDYEKNYCSYLKNLYIDFLIRKTEEKFQTFPPEKQEEMRLDSAIDDLRERITVRMMPGTDIFIINVKAYTSEEAIETANVISRSYTMFDQIQQLAEVTMKYGEFHPTVIQLKDNINNATANLSGKPLPDIEAIGTASVKIIEQATSDYLPVSTPKRIILAVSLLMSLGVSFGLAVIKGLLDRTIKTPQDIVDYLDVPCIGSIPKKGRRDKYLITDNSPDTEYYKFYEELSDQLIVFLKTQGLKSAIITSPLNNNIHKYIVPNLGYFLSRIMGNRVLLIDINFNKPQFKKIYSIKEEKGIDENLIPEVYMEIVFKLDRGPDIIPAKITSDKPSSILNKIDFKNLIEKIKDEYDVILIDATSVNSIKDINGISEFSDGTVMIIDEGKMHRQMLKNSLLILNQSGTPIIGCVLSGRTFPIPMFIYKNFKYFVS